MNDQWKAVQFLENYKNEVHFLADQLAGEELPELTEELFALFEQQGNRLRYEEVYFTRRKHLAVYGMAALIFRRPKDIFQLEEILQAVCAEECWALPAHVNRSQKGWQYTIDLFASETAQTLAAITVLGKEFLSREVCRHVRESVEERVLLPFFHSVPPYAFWEGCDHNWNAVCAGAIGSACLYLWEGKDILPECMERILASLAHYLDGFMEDGACMEGIGYFTYGMTYYIGFARQLEEVCEKQRNMRELQPENMCEPKLEDERSMQRKWMRGKMYESLLLNPKLEQIAQFQQKMYFKKGRTVSFSDGEDSAKFRMGLALFLAERYQAKVMAPRLACGFTSDSCYRFMALYCDYRFTQDYLAHQAGKKESEKEDRHREEKEEEKGRHSVLPYAQWSICESRNGAGMAAKGGHNAEPHNHNDIGSFLYVLGEEALLEDLGAGEYTKEYFGKERYHILCNSSLGHSVPIVDGTEQKEGRKHACGEFSADKKGGTRIEFSKAYEEGLLKSAVRNLNFDLDCGRLVVEDVFVPEKPLCSITEQVVTRYAVEIDPDGRHARVIGKKGACRITLPETAHAVRCVEKPHKNHEGNEEIVRLLQWDLFPDKTIRSCLLVEPE